MPLYSSRYPDPKNTFVDALCGPNLERGYGRAGINDELPCI